MNLESAKVEHHKVWVIAAGLVNDFVAPLKDVQNF
jgi:hypothetical protein